MSPFTVQLVQKGFPLLCSVYLLALVPVYGLRWNQQQVRGARLGSCLVLILYDISFSAHLILGRRGIAPWALLVTLIVLLLLLLW
jgi:hypothetical protein